MATVILLQRCGGLFGALEPDLKPERAWQIKDPEFSIAQTHCVKVTPLLGNEAHVASRILFSQSDLQDGKIHGALKNL